MHSAGFCENGGMIDHMATHRERTLSGWSRTWRRAWTFMRIALLLVTLLLGCAVVKSAQDGRYTYEKTFYWVTSDRVSGSIRFVLITDLHLRQYGEDNALLVEDIDSLRPDAILLGGDLVTGSVEGYDGMLSLCAQLADIAPTYMVTGNHEEQKMYSGGDYQLVPRFEAAGVEVLINRAVTLEMGEDTVELVGLSGNESGFDSYGGRDCMESLDADYEGFRVVMAHVPTLFPDVLESYAFDLGVAGHTHGGVVRLPYYGGLYSREEGLWPTYDGGSFDLANGAQLIVSRGMGSSSEAPRIFNLPELVVIDVSRY